MCEVSSSFQVGELLKLTRGEGEGRFEEGVRGEQGA